LKDSGSIVFSLRLSTDFQNDEPILLHIAFDGESQTPIEGVKPLCTQGRRVFHILERSIDSQERPQVTVEYSGVQSQPVTVRDAEGIYIFFFFFKVNMT